MKNCWNKILLGAMLLMPAQVMADINIAVITPMGNDYKYFSEELINGAKIAVDEINNRGGLEGKKVNLIPIDDPCDDTLSLSAAQMMALTKSEDNKMYLVLGPYCSNAADQVADLLSKAKILQMHPVSISSGRYLRSHQGIIRFTGYQEEQVTELTRFINAHYPQKTLAVIYDSHNPEMASMAEAIKQSYAKPEINGKVVFVDYGTSRSSVQDEVDKAEASIVYIMGDSSQILKMAKSLRNEDENLIVFVDKYKLHKKFIRKNNTLAKNSYLLSLPSLTNNPNFASSLVRLRLWGVEPEGLMPYGYLSVRMWANLVREAKSFKYGRLLKLLKNKNINTGWDNVVYSNGVPDKSLPYIIYRVQNGEYAQVY